MATRLEMINQLMGFLNIDSIMRSCMDTMRNGIKDGKNDNIVDAFFDACDTKEFAAEFTVVFRHYTDDDLVELIKFYSSPIGMKMISLQPAILQDSMRIGQEYGQRINDQIVKKLFIEELEAAMKEREENAVLSRFEKIDSMAN